MRDSQVGLRPAINDEGIRSMDFAKELIQSAKEALDMAKGHLEPVAVFGPITAGPDEAKVKSDL